VVRWSIVEGRLRAKVVIGEVRHRVSVQPGTDSVDSSKGGWPTVVTHEELLRDFAVVVKTYHDMHGGEVSGKETIWINAAYVTDHPEHVAGVGLFPVL
jgi:hypothetical protein